MRNKRTGPTILPTTFSIALGVLLLIPVAARAQECFNAPEGLVAWWPGDASAVDVQAGLDGTLEQGAGFATGLVGQAFSFDGVDDFVLVPDAVDLNFATAQDFTIDAWINLQNPHPDHGDTIVSKLKHAPDGFSAGYRLNVAGVIVRLQLTDDNIQNYVMLSNSGIPLDTWTHVAAVRQGDTGLIYIDGALDATQTLSDASLANTWPLSIAGIHDTRNVPPVQQLDVFAGLIDEVEVFNRALTASEIQAIYDAGAAGKCKDEDGDGFRPPEDCDETDASVNPDAVELPGNFVDENCNGDLGACDPCLPWRNHGEYVRCVAHDTEDLVDTGDLTETEGDELVASAAQSDIGKKGFVPEECQ